VVLRRSPVEDLGLHLPEAQALSVLRSRPLVGGSGVLVHLEYVYMDYVS